MLSPDSETFSTPPTTPAPHKKPSSIYIDHSQNKPHIVALQSPDVGMPLSPAVNSPCLVHSLLDKAASLTDWLHNDQQPTDLGVAKSLQRLNYPSPILHNPNHHLDNDNDIDDDFGRSLTKRLAETVVGVREMSKELGRARIQSNIQTVLVITKARDNRLIKLTRELALYLMLKHRPASKRGLIVYVDNQLRHSRRFDAEGIQRDHPELFVPFPRRRTSSNHSSSSLSSQPEDFRDEGQLRYWTSSMCSRSPHLFDFVVTLGGDGTVLFTSWLFQHIVPPVLPFALGSLGFLTNFDFADHQAVMDSALDNGIRVNLRMRFTCTVYRAVIKEPGKGRKAVKKGETGEIIMKNIEKGGWEALEGGGYALGEGKCHAKDKEIMCFTTRPVETFEVLNDLVVDRGPSPYVSLLELFGDEHHMTTVQADGLTVSTPTGSTAYSLSAGGSLVHPEIPALLITPICPHTLSFRPMLLPDSMELRICVPYNSRSTAWASFDGRGRIELKQGDHIKVTASRYPFPTVCADKQSTDWFHSISRTLKWNERERQKSFVVVEEGPAPRKRRSRPEQANEPTNPVTEHVRYPTPEDVILKADGDHDDDDNEEDEVSDEEEEEGFDIDDSSPEAEANPKEEERNDLKRPIPVLVPTPTPRTPGLKNKRTSKSRSRSRPGGVGSHSHSRSRSRSRPSANSRSRSRSAAGSRSSGVDSPGRFSTAHPVPRSVSPRHVEFSLRRSDSSASEGGYHPDMRQGEEWYRSGGKDRPRERDVSRDEDERDGTRDDIHSPRPLGAKSRIPIRDKDRDREYDVDSGKTPTLSNVVYAQRPRAHSRAMEQSGHRAFAVWGHDESDSGASDSDV